VVSLLTMENLTKLSSREQNLELMKSLAEQNPNLLEAIDMKGRKCLWNFYTPIDEDVMGSMPISSTGNAYVLVISEFGCFRLETQNTPGKTDGHDKIRFWPDKTKLITQIIDESEKNLKLEKLSQSYTYFDLPINNPVFINANYSSNLPDSSSDDLKQIAIINSVNLSYNRNELHSKLDIKK